MQISKIFITHFHGDHFLGLPGLIQTMQLNDREKPLHIYGPPGMIDLTKKLLNLGYFRPTYEIVAHEINKDEKQEFDGYKIISFKVSHGVPSFGYVLVEDMRPGKFNKKRALELGIPEGRLFSKLQKGEDIKLENGKKITPDMVLGEPRKGRKIVISGDTRPTEDTLRYSKGADVLIHEATFSEEFKDISGEYGHSTASEAAEIAKKASVKSLYLTHISPRYLDNSVILKEAKKVYKNSFVPNDFQKIEIKLKK
jgi:ribonuclease Z